MTKYIIGMVGSFGTLLVSAWLMLAPFALGYQPSGAGWTNATVTDFWTGLVLLVISLLGMLLYSLGLSAELRRLGIIERRVAPASAPAVLSTNGTPGSGTQGNMEQVLQTLATALLRDMQEQQRREGSAPASQNSRVYSEPAEIERSNEL
jgi:hypothetical protein